MTDSKHIKTADHITIEGVNKDIAPILIKKLVDSSIGTEELGKIAAIAESGNNYVIKTLKSFSRDVFKNSLGLDLDKKHYTREFKEGFFYSTIEKNKFHQALGVPFGEYKIGGMPIGLSSLLQRINISVTNITDEHKPQEQERLDYIYSLIAQEMNTSKELAYAHPTYGVSIKYNTPEVISAIHTVLSELSSRISTVEQLDDFIKLSKSESFKRWADAQRARDEKAVEPYVTAALSVMSEHGISITDEISDKVTNAMLAAKAKGGKAQG